MAQLKNGGHVDFQLKPVVIQGGTYKGVSYNGNTSIFHMYNAYTVGSPENETIDTRVSFDYDIEETTDEIRIKVKGVSGYGLTITSLRRGTPFPVHDSLVNANGQTLVDLHYRSGVGYSYNQQLGGATVFGSVPILTIKKSEFGQAHAQHVGIKLLRFDDLAADPSGDNKIELWFDAIAYFPPPEFRPWATRKNGTFLSHQTHNGWFKIRKGGNWSDVSTMSNADRGASGQGKHRIRHGGAWVGQTEIGN